MSRQHNGRPNGQHSEWTDQFSDYLSGDLNGPEREGLEEHVAGCGACREVLAQVSQVVALAGDAAQLEPPRDLWPGVAASIGSGIPGIGRDRATDVIALPTARGPAVTSTRAPSRARLAAAAVLLVAVSVGTTWRITSGLAPESAAALPEASAPAAISLASDELAPAAGLADQLRVLEQFLVAARETLDPATVLVLERNLNAIETAIVDSSDALAQDPGNGFLIEHLGRMYRQKLLYLQDAVRVVEWAS
jgi:anti-sigma factor RsiW